MPRRWVVERSFGSQSWPYPHSLMLGFYAEYAGGELCPQAGEIEDVQWFPLNALPLLPHPSTIAFQMLQARFPEFVPAPP